MIKIIAATHNSGKLKEIKQILNSADVLSLFDLSYFEDIPENGSTFYENALQKAFIIRDVFKNTIEDSYILADDSGLEVEALGGRPGIYSARYAGENSTQGELIDKILGELSETPDFKRSARFVSSMVLLAPGGLIHGYEGYCRGRIGREPRGSNGFGYDPVFLPEEYNYEKTMAELSDEAKNEISHRRKALDGIKIIVEEESGL